MGAVYTQLSLQERRKIENWWHAKVAAAEVTRVLKRHKSTIFREIKRNFRADDAFPKKYAGYVGHAAHLQTQKRRSGQRADPESSVPLSPNQRVSVVSKSKPPTRSHLPGRSHRYWEISHDDRHH